MSIHKNRNLPLLIILLCIFAHLAPVSAASRPNIIFIFADDWGWGDLSCHGHEMYKTPNLDKLATQGTEFSQFTVAASVCSPSRAGVMTGHYPARHSIHQHFSNPTHNKKCGMPDWLDPTLVMLPRLFQQAGYKTAHYGKWHLTNAGCDDAPWPAAYGYDESGVFNGYGPQIPASDATTYDKTIEFMTKHKDEPFFINVWMHEPHTPHWPKKEFLKQFQHLDEQHRVYAAILAEADHGVGRILQALDDLGLADNTLLSLPATMDRRERVRETRESGFPMTGIVSCSPITASVHREDSRGSSAACMKAASECLSLFAGRATCRQAERTTQP